MSPSLHLPIIAFMLLLIAACSEAPHPPAHDRWSTEEEVIYQLQEIIKYEDQQALLERQQLESLQLLRESAVTPKP